MRIKIHSKVIIKRRQSLLVSFQSIHPLCFPVIHDQNNLQKTTNSSRMQSRIAESASHLLSLLDSESSDQRIIIGIAGGPGSGKSEFAKEVCDEVNRVAADKGATTKDVAVIIGMDGWHYSRKQLDEFPDSADAHIRRGAHDTFDARGFVSFVHALKSPSSSASAIYAPSFSHALKDPVENSVTVLPQHRIVLLEGLYLALDLEPWIEAAQLLDERWLITVDEETARRRIIQRHLKAGICTSEEEAAHRANSNDLPNGRYLLSRIVKPVREIPSFHDPRYAT